MAERKTKSAKVKETPVEEVLVAEIPAEKEAEEEKDWANLPAGGEVAEFKGKYIKTVGRRKTAVAKVRLYEGGKGIIMVNGLRASQYFPGEGANLISQPLRVTGHGRDYNFSIIAQSGGKQGQIGAVRLGIARAVLAIDPAAKEALKANDFLTRDPRQVERKKPGLRKARKAPQWSKR
ncbi:MAG: 30S ribosomal protein S9 [Candidatus Falkowbacteria bacterium]|nr:30S ribosomal protein S9 [Candidatus Falkowbacteria bacterium]